MRHRADTSSTPLAATKSVPSTCTILSPRPSPLPESKAGQQAGQIDRGYGHKLEKTAAGHSYA